MNKYALRWFHLAAVAILATATVMAQDNSVTTNPKAKTGGVRVSTMMPNLTGTVITHSSGFTIVALNSVSCNAGGLHTDNSYWRSFNLTGFGITGAWVVDSVVIGVEQATGATGVQPVTCRLSTSNPAFPGGTRTPISEYNASVPDQNLTLYGFPVTGSIPAGSELVVEIFTPNGQTALNTFFIGSNASGQTAPSYISAADCGIANPTDLTSIGFPNMHIVMLVYGHDDVSGANDYQVGPFVDYPALFVPDQAYDIMARVENNGTDPQTNVPVRFFVDGIQSGSDLLVSLAADEADTVTFSWTPTAAGIYDLEIQSFLPNDTVPGNDSVMNTATVVAADYGVTGFVGFADTITVGLERTIAAEVVNLGSAQSNVPVKLYEDGVEVGSVLMTLGVSGVDTAEFSWTPSTGGLKELKVKSLLAGDINAANDSVTNSILVYPQGLATFVYSSGTVDIPINDLDSLFATITIPDSLTIYDINVIIDSLTHTWDSDMDIFLMPRGTASILELSTDNGSSGDNMIGTILDDEASVSITTAVAPMTGSYIPEGLAGLAQYDGLAANGDWTLRIADDAGGDVGFLHRWSIVILGFQNPIVGVNDPAETPKAFSLSQNYPNPFNPTTSIQYSIKDAGKVSLRIFNVLGQEVRTLVNTRETAGVKTVLWDGKDNHGHAVSSGVYFYRLESGSFTKSLKMLLVK